LSIVCAPTFAYASTYVSAPPASTASGESAIASERPSTDSGSTSVGSLAALFDASGSASAPLTVAVLQMSSVPLHGPSASVPPTGALSLTRTVTVSDVCAPLASAPTLHVSVPAECVQPGADTNVVLGSSVSVTTTLVALLGPRFCTLIV
jgi:hypothetical protein